MVALPEIPPAFAPDPVGPYEAQSSCSPDAKVGVRMFRDWVLRVAGGSSSGISRDCAAEGVSEHKEGRAWDWHISASDPAQRVTAEQVLEWLTQHKDGVDAANARRVGLMYAIWNRRIWSITNPVWRAYGRPNPHTDHVHFSFTWPGARGETSFYQWLKAGEPAAAYVTPQVTQLGVLEIQDKIVAGALMGAAAYVAAKWLLGRGAEPYRSNPKARVSDRDLKSLRGHVRVDALLEAYPALQQALDLKSDNPLFVAIQKHVVRRIKRGYLTPPEARAFARQFERFRDGWPTFEGLDDVKHLPTKHTPDSLESSKRYSSLRGSIEYEFRYNRFAAVHLVDRQMRADEYAWRAQLSGTRGLERSEPSAGMVVDMRSPVDLLEPAIAIGQRPFTGDGTLGGW